MTFYRTVYFMRTYLGGEGEYVPCMCVVGMDQRSMLPLPPMSPLKDWMSDAPTIASFSYGFPDCGDYTQVAQFVHKVLFPTEPSPCPFHLIFWDTVSHWTWRLPSSKPQRPFASISQCWDHSWQHQVQLWCRCWKSKLRFHACIASTLSTKPSQRSC